MYTAYGYLRQDKIIGAECSCWSYVDCFFTNCCKIERKSPLPLCFVQYRVHYLQCDHMAIHLYSNFLAHLMKPPKPKSQALELWWILRIGYWKIWSLIKEVILYMCTCWKSLPLISSPLSSRTRKQGTLFSEDSGMNLISEVYPTLPPGKSKTCHNERIEMLKIAMPLFGSIFKIQINIL